MTNKRSISHLGVYIKDSIDALGIEVYEFGNRTGIPPTILTQLIKGNTSITYDIASNLSLFFGTDTEIWMNLQARYDRG